MRPSARRFGKRGRRNARGAGAPPRVRDPAREFHVVEIHRRCRSIPSFPPKPAGRETRPMLAIAPRSPQDLRPRRAAPRGRVSMRQPHLVIKSAVLEPGDPQRDAPVGLRGDPDRHRHARDGAPDRHRLARDFDHAAAVVGTGIARFDPDAIRGFEWRRHDRFRRLADHAGTMPRPPLPREPNTRG